MIFHGDWTCVTYKSTEKYLLKSLLKEVNKQKRIPHLDDPKYTGCKDKCKVES